MPPHPSRYPNPLAALRANYLLYLYEAGELAAFMISACLVTVLLFDPAITPIHNPWVARALMGVAMGLTAILIIKSPCGQRSGAHFNPAISLAFFRLGKIGPWDTFFYIASHFLGAIAGVAIAAAIAGPRLAIPQVDYAVTIPGLGGEPAAFAAETFMAAMLMATVLATSNSPRLAPFTTYLVGFLIANYILFFAPVSGYSINPARTVGSAVFARVYTDLWLYFVAPTLGMMFAAEVYLRLTKPKAAPTGIRHYLSHRHLTQRDARFSMNQNSSS